MKAQTVSRVRESAIVMDLSDLEREASQILASARAEATRIVTEAKDTAAREGVRIREEARLAGHRDGFGTGHAEGTKNGHDEAVAATAQRLGELTERWSKTLDILQQHMPAHVADAKTDLVQLALAVALRVTHAEALRNKQVGEATIEETLRLIGSARKVALHVHPDELSTLEAYVPTLTQKMRTIESVELIADETVGPGGCEAHFGAGKVDARLETQVQRIAAELLATDD